MVRRDETTNIEDLLLRPGRLRIAVIDGLHAPEIRIGRQAAAQDLVGFKTGVARPGRHRPAEDIIAFRFGTESQVIGQLVAFGVGAWGPTEENAIASDGGFVQGKRWSRRTIRLYRALVVIKGGVALAVGVAAGEQEVGATVFVVIDPGGGAAGETLEQGFGRDTV